MNMAFLRFLLQRRYRNYHACIGKMAGLHSIQGVFLALVFHGVERLCVQLSK